MNVDITAIIHTHTQVEVTKFEDLEETHAEVRLKQTLWQSQKDWATDYESWLNVRCGNHNTYYVLYYIQCTCGYTKDNARQMHTPKAASDFQRKKLSCLGQGLNPQQPATGDLATELLRQLSWLSRIQRY